MSVDEAAALASTPLAAWWLEQYGEPYRRFLYYLCRGGVSLELGVHLGETSVFMAADADLHIGVDCQGLIEGSVIRYPSARYPSFRFLFCDSLGAAEVVRGILGGRKLDVVFQDTSHHAEPSRLEWEYYRPLLAENFVWVCDDVTPSFQMPDEPRGMMDYFEALPGRKRKFPDLHEGSVMGVVEP